MRGGKKRIKEREGRKKKKKRERRGVAWEWVGSFGKLEISRDNGAGCAPALSFGGFCGQEGPQNPGISGRSGLGSSCHLGKLLPPSDARLCQPGWRMSHRTVPPPHCQLWGQPKLASITPNPTRAGLGCQALFPFPNPLSRQVPPPKSRCLPLALPGYLGQFIPQPPSENVLFN